MEPIIRFEHVTKKYGTKIVLNDISLEVMPGQVLGYIGPNGAGKSTTVKILCGLISQFEGEVFVKGIRLRENPLAVKQIIGYVPELAELYDVLTPHEFLTFMGNLYSLDKNLLENRINQMINSFGLSANLHQRMDTFSKGMRQKVLLISGILHNPDILLLDEPLSGLDANSVIVVKDLITKLASAGKTIFYCSHMMDVVEKVSDRIVVINKGEIIVNSTFDELKTKLGDLSLEKMFSQLTITTNLEQTSTQIVDSIFTNSIS